MSGRHQLNPGAEVPLYAPLTPLQAAWAKFCLDVHVNRPRDLRVCNSPAALTGRAVDVEAQLLIFASWIEALVEDTAQHCHLSRREADYAKGVLQDLAGDLRGTLIKAMENVAA